MIRWLIALIFLLIVSLLVVDLRVLQLPAFAPPLGGMLKDTQDKAIDLLTEQSAFLVSLALAVFGGCAVVVLERAKSGQAVTRTGLAILALVTACCVFSVFFSHVMVSQLVEMIANDLLELLDPVIIWCFRMQYLTLLGAMVCAALFVYVEVIARTLESPH